MIAQVQNEMLHFITPIRDSHFQHGRSNGLPDATSRSCNSAAELATRVAATIVEGGNTGTVG